MMLIFVYTTKGRNYSLSAIGLDEDGCLSVVVGLNVFSLSYNDTHTQTPKLYILIFPRDIYQTRIKKALLVTENLP